MVAALAGSGLLAGCGDDAEEANTGARAAVANGKADDTHDAGVSDGDANLGDGDALGAPVSFKNAVQPIFTTSCSCHQGSGAPMGLDLSKGHSFAKLVNVASQECMLVGTPRKRVAPGQPGDSYLMNKITGTDMCFGSPMPQGLPPLSDDDQSTILRWIEQGAPNN
jgi:hypothetical protein